MGQTGVELLGSYNSQRSNRTLNTTFESSQKKVDEQFQLVGLEVETVLLPSPVFSNSS